MYVVPSYFPSTRPLIILRIAGAASGALISLGSTPFELVKVCGYFEPSHLLVCLKIINNHRFGVNWSTASLLAKVSLSGNLQALCKQCAIFVGPLD